MNAQGPKETIKTCGLSNKDANLELMQNKA